MLEPIIASYPHATISPMEESTADAAGTWTCTLRLLPELFAITPGKRSNYWTVGSFDGITAWLRTSPTRIKRRHRKSMLAAAGPGRQNVRRLQIHVPSSIFFFINASQSIRQCSDLHSIGGNKSLRIETFARRGSPYADNGATIFVATSIEARWLNWLR